MLHHGFPVDAAPFGYSALYVAAAHGNLEVARALCNYGADLNARAHDGSTPLEVSAAMGHVAVMAALLERGAFFGSATAGTATCTASCMATDTVDCGTAAHKAAGKAGGVRWPLLS